MLDMKIEDYRITSDSRNIVLSKVRRDEEGNIRYTEIKEESRADIGYFQSSIRSVGSRTGGSGMNVQNSILSVRLHR